MQRKTTSVRFPPHCHTASAAYDHYMRTHAYINAAQVAFENCLGDEALHGAAFPAICQMLAIGETEAANAIASRFHLPAMNAGDLDYLADLALAGGLPAQLQKFCFTPGPTSLQ